MQQTDDERLICTFNGRRSWVYFVYGNDGWDVVNDYTVNLDPVMDIVNAYAERFES